MNAQTHPLPARTRYFAHALLLLAAPVLTHAQATSTPAAGGAAGSPAAQRNDEVIVLSPFTVDVSQDKGYFAQNTLAGSRMKTNIADLVRSMK